MSYNSRLGVATAALTALASVAAAQPQPRVFTNDDYARAEQFMGYNTTPLVFHAGVRPTWLADDRFWYRTTTPEGIEFVMVDPARKTRGPAFDQAKLAAALSAAAGTTYDGRHLPFTRSISRPTESRSRSDRRDAAGRATCRRRVHGQGRDAGEMPAASGAADAADVPSPDGRRRVHPRLKPLGARRRDRQGDASSRPTA